MCNLSWTIHHNPCLTLKTLCAYTVEALQQCYIAGSIRQPLQHHSVHTGPIFMKHSGTLYALIYLDKGFRQFNSKIITTHTFIFHRLYLIKCFCYSTLPCGLLAMSVKKGCIKKQSCLLLLEEVLGYFMQLDGF